MMVALALTRGGSVWLKRSQIAARLGRSRYEPTAPLVLNTGSERGRQKNFMPHDSVALRPPLTRGSQAGEHGAPHSFSLQREKVGSAKSGTGKLRMPCSSLRAR